MQTHEPDHNLLFDYLYDLLDAPERAVVEERLRSEPAWQEAFQIVQRQQQLLAAAARMEFPGVTFEPPATLPLPRETARPRKNADKPSRRVRLWPWVAAAAVLLALAGGAIPGAYWWRDYAEANRTVEQTQAAIRDARAEIDNITRGFSIAETAKQQKAAALEQAAVERQLKVVVSGPQAVQPGAPNTYKIQTRSLDDRQAVPSRVTVRVRAEGEDKPVFEEADLPTAGERLITLPPNLPLKPGAQLALEVVARRADAEPQSKKKDEQGDKGDARKELQTAIIEKLALAEPVYVTHLATDKPMYRPGEIVRFRSLTLERFTLKPPSDDFQLLYVLRTPTGEEQPLLAGVARLWDEKKNAPVIGPDGKPLRGMTSGELPLDQDVAGGEYTLIAREVSGRFPEQVRKFLVNRYEKPRLNKELEWSRKSYGPGEEVLANCKVAPAEGGKVLANLAVEATVRVDGVTYDADGKPSNTPIRLRTDDKGTVAVRFKLPKDIQRGEGTLSVNFNDGGNDETLSKPIPIVARRLQVEFYPEGGDLVAGAVNRVYFQARTMLGKAADLKAHVVDDTGKVVRDGIFTLTDPDRPGANQGQGVFAFTPEAGRKYELKIDAPVGIQGKYELPAVKDEGVVLSVPTGVTGPKESIRVTIASPKTDRALLVGAYCRGRLLDHQQVKVKQGETATVELKPTVELGGVCRVTVFEEQINAANQSSNLRPVAERLVYRTPAEGLNFTATPSKPVHVPGDRVTLKLSAIDEKEEPAPAIVTVAVVDKSVLTLADEKTYRSMPTHFFLTTEVRKPEDLEHADFLLTSHPRAKESLDLLLGTQGWRRFAEQNPGRFRQEQAAEADRLLMAMGQSSQKVTDFLQEDFRKLEEEYQQTQERLTEQHEAAVERLSEAQKSAEYLAATTRVQAYNDATRRFLQVTTPRIGVVVFAVLCVVLFVALVRGAARNIPIYAGGLVCALLLLTLVSLHAITGAIPQEDRIALNRMPEALMEREGWAGAPPDAGLNPPHVFEDAAGVPFPEAAPLVKAMPMEAPGGLAQPAAPPGAMGGRGAGAIQAAKPGAARPPVAKGFAGWDKNQVEERAKRLVENNLRLENAEKEVKQLDRAKDDQLGRNGMDRLPQRFGGLAGRFGNADGKARQLRDMDAVRKNMEFRRFAGPANDAAFAAGEQLPPPPFLVREYAHSRTDAKPAEVRSDFTETLLWQPTLVLADGKGEVSFHLSDSVTTYQVAVFGHTLDGRIGSMTTTLEARLPFTLEPKVPVEINANDTVELPVAVANNTDDALDVQLKMNASGLTLLNGKAEDALKLDRQQRTRKVFRFKPSVIDGRASVTVEGETKPFAADAIRRDFVVVPEGFPIVQNHSDLLEKVAVVDVTLPGEWVKGTLKLRADVFPSTLADLQKGLEALLREPGGCFEQTSTSNYPNLLILDYLRETDQSKPEVEGRARQMLARGYAMLTSFECPYDREGKHGYEWFGARNAAHEALTAYGLLQFRDMSRVQKVDEAMLERTRSYLMAMRDGNGGFKRNAQALDTFGRAPEDITNAYIVWSITESGPDDVSKELARLTTQANASKDPYFVAMVANALLNRDGRQTAVELLEKVKSWQKDDGHLDAAQTSITGSGGRDLQIETTALAVLGWLKATEPGKFTPAVQKAVTWIGQQRGGYGGFGSTQSTILALKALIAFAKANKRTPEAGEVRLFVGGEKLAVKQFAAGTQEAIELALTDAEKHLKPGKNQVKLEITGDKNIFPCTIAWEYRTLQPVNPERVPVKVVTALDRTEVGEGESVRLTVKLENTEKKGQGMAVAVIGLPGGLTLPEDLKQLKEHATLRNNGTERGLISAFEIRGRELVLYWRDLAPEQKIEVPMDLICRVPGEYRGPASRAYLYYNADLKYWVEPLQVSIRAKD